MQENRPPMWSFFLIILLGLWLITGMATFHFDRTSVTISDLVCGVLLVVLGLYGRRKPTALLLWTIAAIGIWIEFAPLVFWAPSSGAYINNTLVGALVITLSVVVFPIPGQASDDEPTIPPGWSYNPSSWPQRMPVALFAFLCWMISRYLAAYQLGYIDTVWDPFFNPGTKGVLTSSVSKLFPVSDAGLGAFAYTLEFLSTLQSGRARWRSSPWGVLIFGILVIPVSLVSVCLIILQPLAVGTWCTLCLVTAVLMLVPIPLAVDEVAATLQYLRYSKEKPKLQLLFHGGNCPEAKPDSRTPSFNEPLKVIFKSSLWGVTFPWNLCLTVPFGICLMAFPSSLQLDGILYDLDPIIGAFTIVVSVICMSEHLRKARFLNLGLAAVLFISAFFADAYIFLHLIMAIVIGVLCIRKGNIREKGVYGHRSM